MKLLDLPAEEFFSDTFFWPTRAEIILTVFLKSTAFLGGNDMHNMDGDGKELSNFEQARIMP